MRGSNWITSDKERKDSQLFFDQLSIKFPDIACHIKEEEPDMIHSKMECFADYTITQIKNRSTNELKACFDFLEERLELNSKLEDALNTSYLESLIIGESHNETEYFLPLMPKRLKKKCLKYKSDYEFFSKNYIKGQL